MLCYVAIVPSTPLVCGTSVSGEVHTAQDESWDKLVQGVKQQEDACKKERISHGIVINPLPKREGVFGIQSADTLTCSLREYGELKEWKAPGAPEAAQELLEGCAPLAAGASETKVHNSAAAAWKVACAGAATTRLVPLVMRDNASPEQCVRMGKKIGEVVAASSRRYGVFAPVDLSHYTAEKKETGGTRANAMTFDHSVLQALSRKAVSKLIDLAHTNPHEWSTSGMPTMLLVAGMLTDLNTRYTQYAFAAPFGVGYVAAEFIMA